jgi:hypothetical protein
MTSHVTPLLSVAFPPCRIILLFYWSWERSRSQAPHKFLDHSIPGTSGHLGVFVTPHPERRRPNP